MNLFLRNVAITFLINICGFCTAFMYMGNTIITTDAGGNQIIIENNNVNCGGLMCPVNTFKCVIQRRGNDDNMYIETTKSCLASDDTSLSQSVVTSSNPYPGSDVRTYTAASINGNTVQCSNCDGFDSKAFQANMAEVRQRVGETVANVNRQVGETLRQVQANVANTMNEVNQRVANVRAYTDGLGDRIRNQVNRNLYAAGL